MFNDLINDSLSVSALNILGEVFVTPLQCSPQQLIVYVLAFTSCSELSRVIHDTFPCTYHSPFVFCSLKYRLLSEEILKINAAGKTHAEHCSLNIVLPLKRAEDNLLETVKSIACWIAKAAAGGHWALKTRIFPLQYQEETLYSTDLSTSICSGIKL